MSKALLIISTSYPRSGDGSEAAGSFVADLVEELSTHIPVRVLAPGDSTTVDVVSPRMTVYRFRAPKVNLGNLKIASPSGLLNILGVLRSGLRASMHATDDCAVVHTLACWALPSGWWARRLLRRRSIPYSVWMLGSDVWSLGRIPIVRRILRSVMRDADRRYADGLRLAQDSQRICGREVDFLPSTRRLQTRNSPPPATRPPYRLVFIGRWHANKGIDLFLDALTSLGDADWHRIAAVRIFGGGPLNDLVQQKAKLLQQAGRPVAVIGFIAKQRAEQEIADSDYVVIPSRIESIPVVFSDAVKLGRPIVAMPVGDFPALFAQARCGLLARDVSASAFCEALREALATVPGTFDAGVRQHAAAFDFGAITAKIMSGALANGR